MLMKRQPDRPFEERSPGLVVNNAFNKPLWQNDHPFYWFSGHRAAEWPP